RQALRGSSAFTQRTPSLPRGPPHAARHRGPTTKAAAVLAAIATTRFSPVPGAGAGVFKSRLDGAV
ncbi:hypothetical protein ABZ904_50235, partial [Streptomyces sp. NPDC046900]|uniref:hypothetical protein n=1 Tax=Streptomyces sp. NPDC046900 TaxID=3155473 RepID=UPI0033E06DD5